MAQTKMFPVSAKDFPVEKKAQPGYLTAATGLAALLLAGLTFSACVAVGPAPRAIAPSDGPVASVDGSPLPT